jgi:long-chain acyl-CoA synthetase
VSDQPHPPSLAETTAALTAPGQFFEMAEVEIRGVRTRVWKNTPATLRDVLEFSRNHTGEFLVYEDERWSFERHYGDVARFAQVLVERYGVRTGDRVAIAMRNLPEWSIAFWGATAAGTVVVPLNAWWTGPELAYGLADSGSIVLVCDGQRAERVAPHRGDLPALRGTIVAAAGADGARGPDAVEFGEALSGVPMATALPAVELATDDDATIFYTSGTTGKPKGAVGTHRNICTNLLSLAYGAARGAMRSAGTDAATSTARTTGQNAWLLSVPFFHATGCHSILVGAVAFGGKVVLMQRWDPGRALELIERERITTFGGVPAMVWQVLDHPDFAKRDLSSVQSIGYGGAPAPPELVRRIEAMFPGRTPSNGYGLTETSAVVTFNSGADYLRKPDSVGAPVPVVEVKVVGPDGDDLAEGDIGELWVKGPNVVKGYWNRADATAQSFTDGWLHTGDIGRVDDEGFIYIVDRAKDMIIRGGENVYCVEVEAALYEHPGVSDAAVIGIPHPTLGEGVGAVVHVLDDSAVTEEDLRAHVAERLAAFKVPQRIWLRREPLPRNAAGKILKRDLRSQLVGD